MKTICEAVGPVNKGFPYISGKQNAPADNVTPAQFRDTRPALKQSPTWIFVT
jgi:hypothetical protein